MRLRNMIKMAAAILTIFCTPTRSFDDVNDNYDEVKDFYQQCLFDREKEFVILEDSIDIMQVDYSKNTFSHIDNYEDCSRLKGCMDDYCAIDGACTNWWLHLVKTNKIHFSSKSKDFATFLGSQRSIWKDYMFHKTISGKWVRPSRGVGLTPKRVGICITGQWSRLEVKSKIKNLIAPLKAKYDISVDVALALTHSNHFVNYRHKNYNENEIKRRNMDLYIEIVDLLLKNVDRFRAVNVEYLKHPTVTPAHVDAVNFKRRAESHVRQYLNLDSCYGALKDMEQEDNHVYDAIVRVRDDLYILKPMDWSHIFHALLEKKYSILAPNYASHGFAPSDKIAFISSNAMDAYFRGPMIVYYYFPALLWGEKDSSSTIEEELNNLGQDPNFVAGHDFKVYKESVWRRGLDIREKPLGSNEQILEKIYAAFGFKVYQVLSFRFVLGIPSFRLVDRDGSASCLYKLYTQMHNPCWVQALASDNLCDFQ